MALVSIPPVPTHVHFSRRSRLPAEAHGDGHRLRIVGLDRVRDERAAFRGTTGPKVTLVVRTADGGRATIAFHASSRRWFLEALEPAA